METELIRAESINGESIDGSSKYPSTGIYPKDRYTMTSSYE